MPKQARSKRALWIAAGACAVVLSLLAFSGESAAPGPAQAAAASSVSAPSAVLSKAVLPSTNRAVDAPPVAPAALVAQVRRTVDDNNRAATADRRAAEEGGWKMVDVPPPDARLTKLDPSLLPSREAELRTQLASTTASPAEADNLAEIARRASEDQTRVLAVEALGRAGAEGQEKLLALLDQLPQDDRARREVIPLLRPASIDSPLAAALAARLDSGHLTEVERQQAAFTLALLSLRDGRPLPAPVYDALSEGSRALLAAMDRLARNASSTAATESP